MGVRRRGDRPSVDHAVRHGRARAIHSDFICFWTGSRFVREARDPYDTISVAALALARRTSITATEAVAVLACLTLVITPYSGSHDQLVLVPAWAIVPRRALERGDLLFLASLPLLVVVLPWTLFAKRDLTAGVELSALMPVLASAVLLATL
jgi:hypothetical protein